MFQKQQSKSADGLSLRILFFANKKKYPVRSLHYKPFHKGKPTNMK